MFNTGLKLNSADKKLNARLHLNKGSALVELKQYALAIVECCKAVDLDKDMWHPYIVRHLAWRHVGLYTKAAEVRSCTWLALSTCTWLLKALSVNALLPDLSTPKQTYLLAFSVALSSIICLVWAGKAFAS